MRQIFVSVDITGPLYWWKEFDTYKVGTTANSTSTMHKLASTPITAECFEIDDYNSDLAVMYHRCEYFDQNCHQHKCCRTFGDNTQIGGNRTRCTFVNICRP